jgi:T-complex protein 1 subunit beta
VNLTDDETVAFRQDLLNIAQTTLSSKIVRNEKEYFARLCVDAVLRMKGSKNLDAIHIIKKPGGSLTESRLEEGFILEKRIGVGCPKRIENAKILIANTAMDADKIKVYGAKVKTDSVEVVAEIEEVERVSAFPSSRDSQLTESSNACGPRHRRLPITESTVSSTDS